MLDCVRVAAASIDAKPGQLSSNLEKIEVWTARARSAGAELVLFPELSLTGFLANHPRHEHESWLREGLKIARQVALPLHAPALETVRTFAADQRMLISVGMLEDAGNLLHNTQVLVGPEGLLGAWRKMHVPMFEMPFYNGGPAPAVVETRLGRIGVNICFDALLPESTRLLAVQNVEIVLFPFAADPPPRSPAGWAAWAGPALRARTSENGVFGVACNYVGRVECAGAAQDFPGGGTILSPRGAMLGEWTAASGECGMLVADLKADDLQAARAEPEFLFRFRRPELYGPLAEGGLG
jgi:N-carbamoylputrescine amidase